MVLLKAEPPAAVASMEELLAIAYAMEQEAVAGYTELARRMRRENRPELAASFERLAAEETQHLRNVTEWSERSSGGPPRPSAMRWELAPLFDDEGAGVMAPALLSTYRAFSTAVRNEERAFLFWTYVAAQAPSDALRNAAEQMAREELGHIATLRGERRRAFHQQREQHAGGQEQRQPAELERRLAELLTARSRDSSGNDADALTLLAQAASDRAERAALPDGPSAAVGIPREALGEATLLCEWLLDFYLGLAETLRSEGARERVQQAAGEVVHCLTALRRMPKVTPA
jgi:rubrerythrin